MVSLEFFIILLAALWPWGSTQPLTEMSTMGKGGRCVGLTTLPLSYADDLEVWESEPSGTLWACSSPVRGLLYVFSNKLFLTQ